MGCRKDVLSLVGTGLVAAFDVDTIAGDALVPFRSSPVSSDEAEEGANAALGGRSAAAAETEKDRRIRQLERTLGRKSLEIEIPKRRGE